jgi:hypothetical protein
MALLFICDNCGEQYKAHLRMKGITYTNTEHTQTFSVENENGPCYQCEEVAQKAVSEALAKRKKKV